MADNIFPTNGTPLSVRQLIETYLAHDREARSPECVKEKKRVLGLFCADFGERAVTSLKPYDLLFWIDKHPKWASGHTKNRIKSTVARPFAAMLRLGLIDRNPFTRLSYPAGETGRDMSDAEFQMLLRHASPMFRRILIFLRFSGARPCELRRLEWTHIVDGAIVQKIHKTAHKIGRPRRIILNVVTTKLLAWIKRRQKPSQFVFLNHYSQPWTKWALCEHMSHVRRRAGVPLDCKLYSARHGYATGAILNGLDIATVGALLGHASVRTTQIYVHMAGKDEFLQAAASQAVRRRTIGH
jgi:site-specific recombinase XerD